MARRRWLPVALVNRLQGLRLPTVSWRRVSTHLVTLFLALLTLSLLYNFTQQVIQSANLETRRAELEAHVAELERENQQLADRVAYAETDLNIERIARDQLNYSREGDVVIVPRFPTQLNQPAIVGLSAPADTAPLAPPAHVPNWQQWWRTFATPTQPPTGQ